MGHIPPPLKSQENVYLLIKSILRCHKTQKKIPETSRVDSNFFKIPQKIEKQ